MFTKSSILSVWQQLFLQTIVWFSLIQLIPDAFWSGCLTRSMGSVSVTWYEVIDSTGGLPERRARATLRHMKFHERALVGTTRWVPQPSGTASMTIMY